MQIGRARGGRPVARDRRDAAALRPRRPETAEFGTRCLLARRLVERGVRFVQLYSGDVNGWDAHDDVEANHAADVRADRQAGRRPADRPEAPRAARRARWSSGAASSAGCRCPRAARAATTTRTASRIWLAGGGVKGGTVHGATDAVGLRAEVDRVHVHDLHATILHLLGLDHTRLTFPHNGRDDRLTDTAGTVVAIGDPDLEASGRMSPSLDRGTACHRIGLIADDKESDKNPVRSGRRTVMASDLDRF